jgi:glucose-1-phosphate adenylyltransferase
VPDDPTKAFASMGNYVFTTDVLLDSLKLDAGDDGSVHDMGGSIVPMLVDKGEAAVYDFHDNEVPGSTPRDHAYWRDVGTLQMYHEAHMDLVSIDPMFNLYNREWPILTSHPQLPGAKFVQGGTARESIVGLGSIIAGAFVDQSVLSQGIRVLEGATVSNSVIMQGSRIGARAVIRNAIIDKSVDVPDGATIGVDLQHDRDRGFTVTETGIVALGKDQAVDV